MSQATEPVSVRILDREYTVGCAPDERDGLLAAARQLDARMREIRSGNRMAALDRVAVLAALNLAHDLQQLQDREGDRERALRRALDAIEGSLDSAPDAPR
ncbi:cell division protein ZapA [Luteimonas pelagia]